jgi:hypothetical protein
MRAADKKVMMRPPGLEPGSPAWKAEIIPLDHERFSDIMGYQKSI